MYQESQRGNASKRQTKNQHCAKSGSYAHDATIPWRYFRKMKRTTAVRNEDVNFTLSSHLERKFATLYNSARTLQGERLWRMQL
jgi:hypothetical protein